MFDENEVLKFYEKCCHDTAIEDDSYRRLIIMVYAMAIGLVLQIPGEKVQENIDSYSASGCIANDG